MLKTSIETLMESFPKTGAFSVIYMDEDTEPREVDLRNAMKPFDIDQFAWMNGVLYEWCGDHSSDYDGSWLATTVEDEVNYYKSNATRVKFVGIDSTLVFPVAPTQYIMWSDEAPDEEVVSAYQRMREELGISAFSSLAQKYSVPSVARF